MTELLLSWTFLFVGMHLGNPLYLIASAVFAVASRIAQMRKEDEEK